MAPYADQPNRSPWIAQMRPDGPPRPLDDAHDLLDLMAAEAGTTARVDRFTGHMGMFSLNRLQVHLRNNEIRRQGGLREESCVISEDAEFLDQIPDRLASFYTVVPQAAI